MSKKIICIFFITLFTISFINQSFARQGRIEIRPIETALINTEDIKSSRFIEGDGGALEIILNKEGGEKMANYTKKHKGKSLGMFIDGKMTSLRKIQSPILEGKLLLTPYDKVEGQKVIEIIKNQ